VLEQEVMKSAIAANNSSIDSADKDLTGKTRDELYDALKGFESKVPRKTGSQQSASMNSTAQDSNSGVNTGLTLLRLKAWMQEPTER
jgi:hypothetical protein